MKKVICFNASPNADGNTWYYLSRICNLLVDNDINARYVNIKDHKINTCNGCLKCKEQKLCVQDDFFTAIQDELLEADTVLIGTPIYFDYPTAEFFTLLGRLSSIMNKGQIKKVAFVFTFGNSEVMKINDMVQNFCAVFQRWFDIPNAKAVLFNKLTSSKVTDHPEYLKTIDSLVAWIMR